MDGNARHTSVEIPVTMRFLRPVALTASTKRFSSQALTVVRSMPGAPGKTSASSGISGPHIFSVVVVTITYFEREHGSRQTNDVVLEMKDIDVTNARIQ